MTGAVGKVYSEALFGLALDESCTDRVFDELMALDTVWRENPQLSKLLAAPTLTLEQKHGVLEKCFGGRVSDIVYNFLFVITDKGRAGYLCEIASAYKAKQYELKNIADADVTTSIPLTEAMRVRLKDKLEKTYGKTVLLHEHVDPSIMGGAVVKYGDTLLDGSVKTELANIGKRLRGTIA